MATDDAAFARALAALLQPAFGATGVAVLRSCAAGPAVERVGREAGLGGEHAALLPGWLFRIARGGTTAVLVGSPLHASAADPQVQAAALLCTLAWRLHGEDASGAAAADAAPWPAELATSIHALRNDLNAGAMNAAVLQAHLATLPEPLRAVAERLDEAVANGARELHRLVALLDATR